MWGQVRRRPCFGEVSVWEKEKWENRMSGGRGGRDRTDRLCTVDGVCGRPGYECLLPIEEYQLQCRFSHIIVYVLIF